MLVVQGVAVPVVYHALGPSQFAPYAGLTAAVSLLGVLNLGLGGALVTPLAHAVAEDDRPRETAILGSTLLPLIFVAIVAAAVVVPLLTVLPLSMLFGVAASATPGPELRTAAIIAALATLIALPLSSIESVRQAYQEVHVNNLFGALSNAILCLGILLVSWLNPRLPAFVAVVAVVPPAVRILNTAMFLHRRHYLLVLYRGFSWHWTRRLSQDGASYISACSVGASFLYHWPVYFMARVRPPLESSTFAVSMNLIIVSLSFAIGFAQPVWGATADAFARLDYQWVKTAIRRARVLSMSYGVLVLLAFGLGANWILATWLGGPFNLDRRTCWFAGTYLLLALWEFVHWPFALGLGALRAASAAQLGRSALFAVAVPFVVSYGASALMAALCGSVLLVTAWYYPLLLMRRLERFRFAVSHR